MNAIKCALVYGLLVTSSVHANVVTITDEQQFNNLLKNNRVVVKFSTTWCGACNLVKKSFEDLSHQSKYSGIIFAEVDGDNNSQLIAHNKITAYPTFEYYDNGTLKYQEVGFRDETTFKQDIGNYIDTYLPSEATKPATTSSSTAQEQSWSARINDNISWVGTKIGNGITKISNTIKGFFK